MHAGQITEMRFFDDAMFILQVVFVGVDIKAISCWCCVALEGECVCVVIGCPVCVSNGFQVCVNLYVCVCVCVCVCEMSVNLYGVNVNTYWTMFLF